MCIAHSILMVGLFHFGISSFTTCCAWMDPCSLPWYWCLQEWLACFSIFLMLQSCYIASYDVGHPNHKIISSLLHGYIFVTVIYCNVNVWYAAYLLFGLCLKVIRLPKGLRSTEVENHQTHGCRWFSTLHWESSLKDSFSHVCVTKLREVWTCQKCLSKPPTHLHLCLLPNDHEIGNWRSSVLPWSENKNQVQIVSLTIDKSHKTWGLGRKLNQVYITSNLLLVFRLYIIYYLKKLCNVAHYRERYSLCSRWQEHHRNFKESFCSCYTADTK